MQVQKNITAVTNKGDGESRFVTEVFTLNGDLSRQLTERIDCQNFRLRSSPVGYQSDWHVAGDPTLLIILSGSLRICLRSGESQRFTAGDLFIARDYLDAEVVFSDLHGHSAQVEGSEPLSALHVKLATR